MSEMSVTWPLSSVRRLPCNYVKAEWDCGSVCSVVGTFDDLTFLPELSKTLILPIIKILLAAVKLVFGFRSQITKVNRDHVPVCKV